LVDGFFPVKKMKTCNAVGKMLLKVIIV